VNPPLDTPDWAAYARRALDEDDAAHDVTTRLLGSAASVPATGTFRAEDSFVVAGLPLAATVFATLYPDATAKHAFNEGATVPAGAVISEVRAPADALLGGERVALNFLQRLSGIATVTRRAVDAVAGTGAVITDTRKTTPGLRELEKYAVRIGGGVNHRHSLSDAVLWKDNHWSIARAAGLSLAQAIQRAPADLPLQVEVETEAQLHLTLEAGVKFLLIDNQPPDVLRAWLQQCDPDVIVEASGGITVEGAGRYARAGAHRISMGLLTHSPAAAPISLEIVLDRADS
jgi:nicotinate-nucleotide pyrophosphorylase (carboxylating)